MCITNIMDQTKKKPTILVVDDTPANIDVVKGVLGKNYLVQAAINGKMALQIVKKQIPDLILLDIIMPKMDGYEICRCLKADDASKNIPIIFLTSKTEMQDEVKGLELGAVDYVTKPIRAPILLARVKTHLKLRSLQQALEHQAITDYLTGCCNRRYFMHQASRELSYHHRHQRSLALLMFDIDHFKRVNDTYGHLIGDLVLQETANVVQQSLRKTDIFARFGGEEFIILLPETETDMAMAIAERTRKILQLKIPNSMDKITVSIGVALNKIDDSLEQLLLNVDNALYKAKDNGRDMVILAA